MAWYAKINEGIVVEMVFTTEQYDSNWLYREFGGIWLRCIEDGSIRGFFPTLGFTYNQENDEFVPPQPYNSWLFDQIQKKWVAPIEYPQDGRDYKWNEETKTWNLRHIIG